MSKTLGNVIDPNNIVKKFGTDATRYLLLSQFPFGHDGDVKEEKFVEKYNSDLANGLGNLVARVLTLVAKYKIPTTNYKTDKDVSEKVKETKYNYAKDMQEFKLYEALEEIWKLIGFCDKYVDNNKPWKLIKSQKSKVKSQKLEAVLNNLLYCISEIADLIAPFLPETSEKIKKQLKSSKPEILFPRI
jgi:methionyl-tRNA synthetase